MLDKLSVRGEFDRLKGEFKQLSSDNKVPPECKVLFHGLMMLFELVLSIFLEKHTKKTTSNSSKPPSQTEKDDTALGKPGANGKGKQQTVTQAANTRTIETVTIIPVDSCDRCGEPLEEVPCHCHERRTRIDIIFEKTVEHMDAQIKECPSCHAKVKGIYPSDIHGPLQYGNGLKAYVIQLLIAQMIPLNRVQKMLTTFLGFVISQATLLKYVMHLHLALEQWEQDAKATLLRMPCLHVDETSLRVDRKNHWIHVCAGGDVTLKCLHKKRGKEAMKAIDIIPRYGGVIVHDCWQSYLSYEHCLHALCGSHLLRELTFIIDSNGYAWARNIKKLLQKTCAKVSKSKEKCLSKKDYARLQKHYRNLLTRGKKELPEIPPKPKGKRGKMAKSDAHNLWERLKLHEAAVLLFAKNPHVPFTNNRAERDLRMAKVKQKISGCFRAEKYAHAYCRISSYLQTMENKGYNPLVAIQMALTGKG